jgi:acetoin:2,6-dichlorophenolindophenol oxidoreductase subunit beta
MPETRDLTLAEAVREALTEEMRRDSRVFVCGEDVAEAGTVFKVLSGMVDEFGKDRVLDTPISEAGFTGIAVGAAMTGMRPVVDIMFGDFSTLVMDQMVNRPPKSTTCPEASGRCPWSCAQRSGPRDAPRPSTPNRFMPGFVTFRD